MSSTIIKRPEEIWLEYIFQLVWEKGNLDAASYNAFLRAASLGLPASIAIEEVAGRIQAAGDYPPPGKLEQQWHRAAVYVKANPDTPIVPAVQRPIFDPERAKRFAERVPTSVDLAWLKRRSPVLTWITPAEYLSAIFRHGDQVLVFSEYLSQGEALWQNWSLKVDRYSLKSFVSGHEAGVWFLSNPVDGQYHFNLQPAPRFKEPKEPRINKGMALRCSGMRSQTKRDLVADMAAYLGATSAADRLDNLFRRQEPACSRAHRCCVEGGLGSVCARPSASTCGLAGS